MPLTRTDEHHILADNLRKFLRDHNSPEQRRERLKDRCPRTRLALWRGLSDLGILSAAFQEQAGGLAGDARTIAIIAAELGSSLAVEPFLDCAVIAGHILQHADDDEDRTATIEQLIAGERIIVLAHDSGLDPFARPLLTARREAKRFVLNGTVRCVHDADLAQEYLVSAYDGTHTIVIRTPAALAGLMVESNRLMDDSSAADLHFRDVRLPTTAELRLDEPPEDVIAGALEHGLAGVAAETVGIVGALNRATFQYLMTRKQFGVSIGTFQALRHRAADMYTAARGLESVVDLALDAMAAPRSPARSSCVSAAKAEADRVGTLIGHEAIQMHGGMGVSDELIISHYGRRLATIRTQLGNADVHRLRFGAL